ncbi:MAG: polysaccharide biosynthesis tyrosine autokinase [Kiritimatiellae bacterium]|nr:polysaccharide biosynthesis tyrosine autokinase [Kiritimatiellia bacterium]
MKEMIQPPNLASPSPSPATAGGANGLQPGQKAVGFDLSILKHYLHVVIKRIWLVALAFIVSLVITVVNLAKEVPVYRASATLLLSRGLRLPSQMMQKDPEVIGDIMDTEMQIIQSRVVIERAQDRMNMPPGEIQRKIERVAVFPVGRTAIIGIHVYAFDRQLSAEYCNAIIDAYLEFKAETRMQASQSTVISLTQQANRLRDELKRADDRVTAYKKENMVIALQERGNIAAQTLANLSSQAAELRTERMILEAQQPLLKDADDDIVLAALSSPIPMVSSRGASTFSRTAPGSEGTNSISIVIDRGPEALIEQGVMDDNNWKLLKRRRGHLEDEIATMRRSFRDTYPPLREKLEELEVIDRGIDREVQLALRNYYAELEALLMRERAVRRAESEWEDEAISVSQKADEYESLLVEQGRLQRLYDLVFNRLKEVDISIGIEPETVQLVDPAIPPGGPVEPRRVQSLFMAGLLGIGVGLALAIGLEFLDDSIRYPEDVSRILGTTFLGIVPAANWDRDDLTTHLLSGMDQKSGISEAYRNIRSAFMFSLKQQNVRTLAITSAIPKEGKTTTSLNLAISLSQAGMRILIVDADLRRGEVHKYFGLEGGRGFSDILSGQAKPDAVIQHTGNKNLDLIATGAFPANPAELFLRPEYRAFVEYVTRNYDKVIFDCPPIMAVSESAILASMVDGVLMIVWAGRTSRKLSQLAVQTMRQRGANILGCILNNLEFGRVGYYYYSTYYGYYNYEYSYYDRPRTPTTTSSS